MIMGVEIVCQLLDKLKPRECFRVCDEATKAKAAKVRIPQEAVQVAAPTPDAWRSRSGYIPIEPEGLPCKPR